ncbi:hypothetical protein DB43_DP00240 [Parachlamydia acanthamoebae]|uniref:Uncharacterized protein n=1 Tax=Parachlamydia acanthamoebae TaxID=83552 RepID=A0A0C1EC64_9BACT|nr:hypothetical protein DB43_DP00240 [Parachlamydia acanthamoebae]
MQEQNVYIRLQRLETIFFELLKHLSLITQDIFLDSKRLEERDLPKSASNQGVYIGKLALQELLSLFIAYRKQFSEKGAVEAPKGFFERQVIWSIFMSTRFPLF